MFSSVSSLWGDFELPSCAICRAPVWLPVGGFLLSSLMMALTVSKMSCLHSLRMLKSQTCLSPLQSHDYFLPPSEWAKCKGKQIFPLQLNVWFFLIFPLLPLALQRLSMESCVWDSNAIRHFFDQQPYKDKTYFKQINWFKSCSP